MICHQCIIRACIALRKFVRGWIEAEQARLLRAGSRLRALCQREHSIVQKPFFPGNPCVIVIKSIVFGSFCFRVSGRFLLQTLLPCFFLFCRGNGVLPGIRRSLRGRPGVDRIALRPGPGGFPVPVSRFLLCCPRLRLPFLRNIFSRSDAGVRGLFSAVFRDLVDFFREQERLFADKLRGPVQKPPESGEEAARHGLQDKKDAEYCNKQTDKLFQKTLHVVN